MPTFNYQRAVEAVLAFALGDAIAATPRGFKALLEAELRSGCGCKVCTLARALSSQATNDTQAIAEPGESEPTDREPEPENEPMVKTLEQSDEPVQVAEIRRHGTQITLPDGMSYADAIQVLERRREYEDSVANFVADYDVFPLDGAHALFQVLRETFGFVENVTEWGIFGPRRPALIDVRTGPKTSVQVPWGKFALPPQIGGYLHTAANQKGRQVVFRVVAETTRKNEAFVESLFEKIREFLRKGSIYRGKAVSVRFFDDDNDKLSMPEPVFMDTDVDETALTFNEDTDAAIQTNLFTPITRLHDLLSNDIPVKRGVLLGGPYGTGKTLTARVAAKLAQQHGITFIYVKRADELALAIEFAKSYSDPAVVIFCEDIDRSTSGDRDADMDAILNTLDGVDTKEMNLITLLTTNHIERITRAMLRPGRLDAVITIPPPDAKAVEKLLRIYGRGVIPANADLRAVGEELDGAIPAIVAEVVKRAKLAQLRIQRPGTRITEISAVALLESARTIKAQRELLATEPEPLPVEAD